MELRMKRNILFIFVLLVAIFSLSACATPLTYSAKEIRGQVVDDATGQPIEGAVVVAQWVLFHGGPGHGGHKGRLHIYETVTDNDGRYFIPAWGPKVHPPMTELVNRDPEILIFKSTYEPKTLRNSVTREDSVRVSEWDGKVVKLKKSTEPLEKQGFYLSSFYGSLGYGDDVSDWKNYPRMLLAIYSEKQRLQSLGLPPEHAARVPNIERFGENDKALLKKFAR
jgi:hypothetical protein